MTHESQHPNVRLSAPDALASAISALRGVPCSDAWLRLVGSGAIEASPTLGMVLLDALPKLLVALGAGILRHG